MKILMVNDYADKIGGAEIYMYTLKQQLEKRGYEVSIFHTDVTEAQYIQDHIKVSSKKVIKRLFNVSSISKFKNTVNSFQPDIIHIHGIQNELTPSILLATNHIPVVMTVHNNLLVNSVTMLSERTGRECKKRTCPGCTNCRDAKGVIYEFIKQKIHRPLLKQIKLYITPSNYMKELIEEAGFSPVTHIPNGFEFFPYAPIKNFNQLLYVGRLSKEKGVEYLIGAMPAVLNSHPTAKLTIVGDGSEKENLQKQVKDLKIEKNVTFAPNVPHEKLEKYYQDATIVIVPSIYHDNLPTVCIEAMSVGRPLIGTSMGGIAELIDNKITGLLIQPQNAAQIATAITSLLSNKNVIKQMSQNSSIKSQKYDITNHLKKIENVYKNLL